MECIGYGARGSPRAYHETVTAASGQRTGRNMVVYHPFQRGRYVFRTILSPEECGRRLLDTMNSYNEPGRGRYVMATAIGERFKATVEPGSLGSSGSGAFMKHFVVEATGSFRPQRDGTVDVTIGFNRVTSVVQIALRLFLISLIALSYWVLIASPIVPLFAVAFGIGIAPFFLLWSLVAFAQGMRQGGKDWRVLYAVMESALGSHQVERA